MGSTCPQVDIPALIALYRAGRYKLDELIAGRYTLDKINEALSSSAAGEALGTSSSSTAQGFRLPRQNYYILGEQLNKREGR